MLENFGPLTVTVTDFPPHPPISHTTIGGRDCSRDCVTGHALVTVSHVSHGALADTCESCENLPLAIPRNNAPARLPAYPCAPGVRSNNHRCTLGCPLPHCKANPNGSSVRHFAAKTQANGALWPLDFPVVHPMGCSR